MYIYYNKKVKKIKVKKIHFEILKISLTASLHICSILNVRLIFFLFLYISKKKKKKLRKPKTNAKKQQEHENQIICVVFTDCVP